MLCNACGQIEANVFFKAVVDNKTTKLNLCEDCAKTKGILSEAINIPGLEKEGFSLSDIVSGLISQAHIGLTKSLKVPTKPIQPKCPQCATSFPKFKSSGFIGCDQCYEAFYPAMKDIIKRMHGSNSHTGKLYGAPSKQAPAAPPRTKQRPASVSEQIRRLKSELALAIKDEAYERAALLRDKIRELGLGKE